MFHRLILLLIIQVTAVSDAASVPTSVARARNRGNEREDSDTCDDPSSTSPAHERIECEVFMAPSTLGNHSNLGIYTASSLSSGEVINFPEVAIPILFRNFEKWEPKGVTLFDRYLWGGFVANIDPIDDLNRELTKSVFVPGLGCALNSLLELNNVNSTHGSNYDPSVPRNHPAAGSFSPYYNSKTVANRDIPSGSELFASYGEGWIPWIPDIPVTLNKHMDRADEFIKEYLQWTLQLQKDYGQELTVPLMTRLWTLTKSLHKSRDFSVLPKELDWNKVSETMNQKETDNQQISIETREYWLGKSVRSLEWLQKHGKCQDHIKPGLSTIPNAGRGAFASRYLPKGTAVGYSPLIHIGEGGHELLSRTRELLINYSFSHRSSTLLLTPYGAGVMYINHASKPRQPNVRLQWPKDEMIAHKPNWLSRDVNFLRDTPGTVGLSLEYIALRDILEGEEILMDYGSEWQQAWDDHVANYTPPEDANNYVHSSQFEINELKTLEELKEEPYPSNLHTLCKPSFRKDKQSGRHYFTKILREDGQYVHCHVLEREPGPLYTVNLTLPTEFVTVHQVTQPEGIDLFDKALSQDFHLAQSFRHYIGIPDDLFPESWKNKLES